MIRGRVERCCYCCLKCGNELALEPLGPPTQTRLCPYCQVEAPQVRDLTAGETAELHAMLARYRKRGADEGGLEREP